MSNYIYGTFTIAYRHNLLEILQATNSYEFGIRVGDENGVGRDFVATLRTAEEVVDYVNTHDLYAAGNEYGFYEIRPFYDAAGNQIHNDIRY